MGLDINQGDKTQEAGNNVDMEINELTIVDPKWRRTERPNTDGLAGKTNQEGDTVMDPHENEQTMPKNLLLVGAAMQARLSSLA